MFHSNTVQLRLPSVYPKLLVTVLSVPLLVGDVTLLVGDVTLLVGDVTLLVGDVTLFVGDVTLLGGDVSSPRLQLKLQLSINDKRYIIIILHTVCALRCAVMKSRDCSCCNFWYTLVLGYIMRGSRCIHDQTMHVAMPKIVSLCVWVSVHGTEINAC